MGELLSGSNAIWVVLVILVVLVVGGNILKRKANQAGEAAGRALATKVGGKLQTTLASSLRLPLDAATAGELVAEAVATMKLVTRTSPTTWDLEAIGKRDLTFAVVPVDGGSELLVERYREQFGNPSGAPYWKDVVKKTTALAEQRGLTTAPGTIAHVRAEAADEKNWWWTRAVS